MGAEDYVPDSRSLKALRSAAAGCRGCGLWKDATQTVFGEGPRSAEVVMVGEQPGDREDLEGRPFVGPAGRILDRALEEAGIDRGAVFLTNVVKHFKFTPRGKRRIHKRPAAEEIAACRPWLEAEMETVKPRALVALGATAAQALLGRQFRVSRQRGVPVDSPLASLVMATVHPSSILRADEEDREKAMAALVTDLRALAREMQKLAPASKR